MLAYRWRTVLSSTAWAGALLLASHGYAAEVFNEDGVVLRWDNTLRYTAAVRVAGQSAELLAEANGDDGDRDFAAGLVSNRLDVLSSADLSMGDFGLHVSGAAWLDTVYHTRTDNRSPATYNVIGVPSTTFAPAVRNLHGGYAELRDAFAYGSFALGDIPVSARVGRQTLTWGEGLFYDSNSIASAQSPTDYSSPPGASDGYGSNPYLPVNQVVVTAQLGPEVSLTLYEQLEWRASRLAGDGSYLNYTDFLGAGAGRLFLPDGEFLLRVRGRTPSQQDQFGAALNATWSDASVGLYALTYTSKSPQIITDLTSAEPGALGYYRQVYPRHILLTGLSFSTYVEDSTIAGELSVRQNMPLNIYNFPSPLPSLVNEVGYAPYVKGTLMHLQLSALSSFARTSIWDSAEAAAELIADDVLDTRQLPPDVPRWDRYAMKVRLSLEPRYFQVLSNLDLSVPVELGYNVTGRSFDAYDEQNAGAGDLAIGVSGTYLSVWKASAKFTYFIGSYQRQPLADRSYVSLTVERTL
jgi:hypothetical protein